MIEVPRIVHVINDINADGGAQHVVVQLVAGLQKKGVDCGIVTIHPPASYELAIPGVVRESLRSGPLSATRMLRSADVIHVHLFPSLYLVSLWPGTKVFTEHGMTNRRRGRAWARLLERWVYRKYDKIVCVSDAGRDALSAWLGDRQPIGVVSNGVDCRRFSGQPRSGTRHSPTVGMVASFTPAKDQATLIRAVAELPGFRAAFVGDGPTLPAARRLAATLQVEDRVQFLGRVEAAGIPSFLESVDIYVQSAKSEAFGLAAVEAMAAGLPTLGTDVPGLRETIADPRYLVPPSDHAALRDTLRSLVEDSDAYAEAARDSVRRSRDLDVSTMQAAYLDVYSQLLASRNG